MTFVRRKDEKASNLHTQNRRARVNKLLLSKITHTCSVTITDTAITDTAITTITDTAITAVTATTVTAAIAAAITAADFPVP